MKFLKIENDPEKAKYFQDLGVDRIFLDLEILGKKERQGHLNTVISETHSINDVKKLSKVLSSSKLLVRVNPINESSAKEIEKCIRDGAEILMLPMFKTKKEVEKFINIVDGRVTTCLLLETSEALCRIDEIIEVKGIDEIHIGLNDLHLSLGLDFMFELLSCGIVEYLINKIKKKNIVYGFGGIAPLKEGLVSGELILKEHFRLNSSMAILSRSFSDLEGNNGFKNSFLELKEEVLRLEKVKNKIDQFNSKNELKTLVNQVVEIINKNNKK